MRVPGAGWGLRISGFQIVTAAIGAIVAGTVLLTLGRLAVWSWDEYGTSIPSFYWHDVFGTPALRTMPSSFFAVSIMVRICASPS